MKRNYNTVTSSDEEVDTVDNGAGTPSTGPGPSIRLSAQRPLVVTRVYWINGVEWVQFMERGGTTIYESKRENVTFLYRP